MSNKSTFNIVRFHTTPFRCWRKNWPDLKFRIMIGRFRVTSWDWKGQGHEFEKVLDVNNYNVFVSPLSVCFIKRRRKDWSSLTHALILTLLRMTWIRREIMTLYLWVHWAFALKKKNFIFYYFYFLLLTHDVLLMGRSVQQNSRFLIWMTLTDITALDISEMNGI